MKKKQFILEATIDENKVLKIGMSGEEFSNLELLGVLEKAKADIIDRIKPTALVH